MISIRLTSPSGYSSPWHLSGTVGNLESYTHDTVSLGGFRNCKFSFQSDLRQATEWLFHGLGSQVTAYNDRGTEIWNGLVDTITANIDGDTVQVGPLTGVSNNIAVSYSTPSFGGRENSFSRVTPRAMDEDSVRRYTRLDEIISGGEATDEEALVLRDSALAEKSSGGISESFSSTGDQRGVRLDINCIGFTRLLERRDYNTPYDDPVTIADPRAKATLDVKFGLILDAFTIIQYTDPVARNLEKVSNEAHLLETKDRTSWGIIEDDINKAGLTREVICGFFANQTFQFNPIDQFKVYQRRASSGTIQYQGSDILPSEVLPGIILESATSNRRLPYTINSVSYNMATDTITLNQFDKSIRAVLEEAMLGGRMRL